MSRQAYTIGHSTLSEDEFAALLRQHAIDAIADVRSQPRSGYAPHFSQAPLKRTLGGLGINYVFLGRQLGARSDDPGHVVDGRVDYNRLAASTAFQEGLDRIEVGVSEYRIALLCAEGDPIVCHRAILVARRLVERGLEIQHIHRSGELESQSALETRLLRLMDLPEGDLFASRAEVVAEALERQGQRIAWRPNSKDSLS